MIYIYIYISRQEYQRKTDKTVSIERKLGECYRWKSKRIIHKRSRMQFSVTMRNLGNGRVHPHLIWNHWIGVRLWRRIKITSVAMHEVFVRFLTFSRMSELLLERLTAPTCDHFRKFDGSESDVLSDFFAASYLNKVIELCRRYESDYRTWWNLIRSEICSRMFPFMNNSRVGSASCDKDTVLAMSLFCIRVRYPQWW